MSPPVLPVVTDPLEPAFTRGQVEGALWRLDPANAKITPTSKFKVQIKHLLELDRSEPLPARTASYAFSEEPGAGRGEHFLFSTFDAFLLEIGISLLGVGFKRKDIVLFLRSRRDRWKRLAPLLQKRLRTAASELSLGGKRRMPTVFESIKLQIPAIDAPAEKGNDHLFLTADFNNDKRKPPFAHLIMLDMSFAGYHLPFLLLSEPLKRRGPN